MNEAIEEVQPQRGRRMLVSRRVEFWVAFLALALAVFVFLLPGILQRRSAMQTMSTLRPLVAADARFAKVMVSMSTNSRVILSGNVSSETDLAALREVVAQAHLSNKVTIHIAVGAQPP